LKAAGLLDPIDAALGALAPDEVEDSVHLASDDVPA